MNDSNKLPEGYKLIPNAKGYALSPKNYVVRLSTGHFLKRYISNHRWFSRLQIQGRPVRFFHDEIEIGAPHPADPTLNPEMEAYLRDIEAGRAVSLAPYGLSSDPELPDRDFSRYFVTEDGTVLRRGHARRALGDDYVQKISTYRQPCGTSDTVSLTDANSGRSYARRVSDLIRFAFPETVDQDS